MNEYLIFQLKEGRRKKGLKQSDVTKYTGIKNTTLSNYENGVTEPDIDTFLQLCKLYELNYAEIIGEAYGIGIPYKSLIIHPQEISESGRLRKRDDEYHHRQGNAARRHAARKRRTSSPTGI